MKKRKKKHTMETLPPAADADRVRITPGPTILKLDFSVAVQAKMMVEAQKADEELAKHDKQHAKQRKQEGTETRTKRLQAQIKQQWLIENRSLIEKWMQQEGKLKPKSEGSSKPETANVPAADSDSDESLSDCSKISDGDLEDSFHFKDSQLERKFQRAEPKPPGLKAQKRMQMTGNAEASANTAQLTKKGNKRKRGSVLHDSAGESAAKPKVKNTNRGKAKRSKAR